MSTAAVPPRKIVHVTECLAAGTLGFLRLATSELQACGVAQVLVFSRRPDTPANVESMFDPAIELIELPAPKLTDPGKYIGALRNVLLAQCDALDDTAIHLHSSKAGFFGRLALLGLRRRPSLFYSPHGLSFLDRRWLLPSLLFGALEWLAARVPSTMVGCSRSEARLLGRLSGRPARVLENAVEDSFFDIEPREAAQPMVVSMGRISFQKAPERFAQMAARFQIAESPVRFVWIGAGDPAGEAELRAAGVEVTGWLEAEAIQGYLAEATVYVQTSRWEGMPLSVLQALACGVPCVVTDVVGNRDAVRQGLTGFVVNSVDESLMAVRRLLRDPALRARFSAAATRDAQQRFSSSSFRQRLSQLYGLQPQTSLVRKGDGSGKLLPFTRPLARPAPESLHVSESPGASSA